LSHPTLKIVSDNEKHYSCKQTIMQPTFQMQPEPPEGKDSPSSAPARRPVPSRFVVPAGQRIAEDADSAVSAASFLSREKICGKLRLPNASPKPAAAESPAVTVTNGSAPMTNGEEVTPKRGRGRPPKRDRNSLPGMPK
jgi:hypothetical protein